MTAIPLTRLAKAAGCAAKIGQADLRAALSGLPAGHDPRVMIGHDTCDDAAVIRLRDDLALVETVDIFPPVVDDPFDYGRIAAANALSDVYAMGAVPLNALSFVAWPVEDVGLGPLTRVFEGANAACAEAGIAISGGHSIVDAEPKFGLFVTGTVHPDKVTGNDGARPGDALVLTKPLGTGILTTAVKRGRLDAAGLAPAIEVMTTLNRGAAEAMTRIGIHAATDVTGFGLLGHLGNMLRASSDAFGAPLGASIRSDDVPLLDGVVAFAADGLCPGGSKRNLDHAAPATGFADHIDPSRRLILADAQTSGGLLIAVAAERLADLVAALEAAATPARAVIGAIEAADTPGRISVT